MTDLNIYEIGLLHAATCYRIRQLRDTNLIQAYQTLADKLVEKLQAHARVVLPGLRAKAEEPSPHLVVGAKCGQCGLRDTSHCDNWSCKEPVT
jgi:hypothetical protein